MALQGLESRCYVGGIYFSASWCRPCQVFTSELVDYYNRINRLYPHGDLSDASESKEGPGKKNLEIVLVGLDKTQEKFDEYFAKMPWLSVRFADSAQSEYLTKTFGVTTIPHLVLINPVNQAVLVSKANDGVRQDPGGVYLRNFIEREISKNPDYKPEDQHYKSLEVKEDKQKQVEE
jgi:nucleoredoxin